MEQAQNPPIPAQANIKRRGFFLLYCTIVALEKGAVAWNTPHLLQVKQETLWWNNADGNIKCPSKKATRVSWRILAH